MLHALALAATTFYINRPVAMHAASERTLALVCCRPFPAFSGELSNDMHTCNADCQVQVRKLATQCCSAQEKRKRKKESGSSTSPQKGHQPRPCLGAGYGAAADNGVGRGGQVQGAHAQ